jgi:hypothetical protein
MNKPKTPVPLSDEEIARVVESIRAIGDAGQRIAKSGLSDRAVRVLLADITGLPLSTIKKVLDGLVVLPSVALAQRK